MKEKRWAPQPICYKNFIEPNILTTGLPHQLGFLPNYLKKSGLAKSRVYDKLENKFLHVKNQLNESICLKQQDGSTV